MITLKQLVVYLTLYSVQVVTYGDDMSDELMRVNNMK